VELAPGTIVAGYRVGERIGAGGFGDVYAAAALDGDGAPLAIKVLRAELCQTPEALARFRREAEMLARVAHPGIVAIREVGACDDGRPFLVMDRLAGGDLDARLAARGRMTLAEALAVLEPLADALEAAHAAGVIHRDLKPSNVFLTDAGGVVLLDFGVAKLLDPAAGSLTGSLVAVGTPSCMAPEQIAGGVITARTDVYGLASLAFQLVTGAPVFHDASPTVMQQLALYARRPRPSSKVAVPAAVDAAIVRGLDRDPARRHAGVRALVDELRAAIHAAPAAAPAGVVLAVAVHATGDLVAVETALDHAVAQLRAAGFAVVVDGGDLVVLATDAARAPEAAALAAACSAAAVTAGATLSLVFHVGAVADDTLAWLPDPIPPGITLPR
jgi:eukaryotic-like serine/threonine-protein kinase